MNEAIRPILIAGPPRSGTTMLAGLFHHHGVWIGEARVTKYPSTNSRLGTENIEIKKYLKELLGAYRNWSVPLPSIHYLDEPEHVHFKDRILAMVGTDGPWLVKTSNLLLTWRLWNRCFPDALWVFPERPIRDIVDSAMRHPVMRRRGEKKIRSFVGHLIARQYGIREDVRHMIVSVDRIADKNVEELTRLFSCAGIAPNLKVIGEWIKPGMWHGRK